MAPSLPSARAPRGGRRSSHRSDRGRARDPGPPRPVVRTIARERPRADCLPPAHRRYPLTTCRTSQCLLRSCHGPLAHSFQGLLPHSHVRCNCRSRLWGLAWTRDDPVGARGQPPTLICCSGARLGRAVSPGLLLRNARASEPNRPLPCAAAIKLGSVGSTRNQISRGAWHRRQTRRKTRSAPPPSGTAA